MPAPLFIIAIVIAIAKKTVVGCQIGLVLTVNIAYQQYFSIIKKYY
jgi:hypothetical protein